MPWASAISWLESVISVTIPLKPSTNRRSAGASLIPLCSVAPRWRPRCARCGLRALAPSHRGSCTAPGSPDLVLTQDTQDICDATAADVQRALDGIQPPPQLLILRPALYQRFLRASWLSTRCRCAGPRLVPSSCSLEARVRAVAPASCARPPPTTAGIARRCEPAGGGWSLDSRDENTGLWSGRFVQPGGAAQRLAWTTIRDYDPETW